MAGNRRCRAQGHLVIWATRPSSTCRPPPSATGAQIADQVSSMTNPRHFRFRHHDSPYLGIAICRSLGMRTWSANRELRIKVQLPPCSRFSHVATGSRASRRATPELSRRLELQFAGSDPGPDAPYPSKNSWDVFQVRHPPYRGYHAVLQRITLGPSAALSLNPRDMGPEPTAWLHSGLPGRSICTE